MRLIKQLNIGNTHRALNFNQFRAGTDKFIKVCNQNKAQVEESLKKNKGKGNTYLIIHDSVDEDTQLNKKVYKSKGIIIYYTATTIPIYTMLSMGTNQRLYLVYEYRNTFTKEQLLNIKTAFELSTVIIYIPHVDVSVSPYKYLFSVYDVRYIADAVYYDFTPSEYDNIDNYIYYDKLPSAKPELQKEFFNDSHEVLARWRLQMHLSYVNQTEKKLIRNKIIGDEY